MAAEKASYGCAQTVGGHDLRFDEEEEGAGKPLPMTSVELEQDSIAERKKRLRIFSDASESDSSAIEFAQGDFEPPFNTEEEVMDEDAIQRVYGECNEELKDEVKRLFGLPFQGDLDPLTRLFNEYRESKESGIKQVSS